MANKRIKTKYTGVYERHFIDRTGKAETAFDIVYRHADKKIWEIVGRKSEGVNAVYASRIRAERIKKTQVGTYIPPDKMLTFGQAFEQYMENHMRGKSSYQQMLGSFENHMKHLGSMRLDKIKPIHIEDIKQNMMNKGLAPQTIKHIIALVRQVYRKAVAWGLYEGHSPTEGVSMPKADGARLRFLTEEEAGLLLRELQGRSEQWHDIAYLSLYSGLRLGEVFSLKVGHLQFDAGVIHVMDAKAGTRAAYMVEGVRQVLKQRCEGRGGQEFVFTQSNGEKIKYISSTFKRVADMLFNDGVVDARHKVVFHTLRHTFGSWLAQRGVPLYTIAELMGHSSLEMTKRYSKLSPDTKRDAIALLPASLT